MTVVGCTKFGASFGHVNQTVVAICIVLQALLVPNILLKFGSIQLVNYNMWII